MSGLIDEEDVPNFPGCKPDDWQNPFREYNLKTPCVLIAYTLAGIIERLEAGSPLNKDNCPTTRMNMLKLGYGWSHEAINLFEELLKQYDIKMVKVLRKYFEDYKEYYGGTEKLNEYLRRGKKRYEIKAAGTNTDDGIY